MGFRLALGFALIAAISAGAAGGITTWTARANILEAEQNRLLANFESIASEMPLQLSAPTTLLTVDSSKNYLQVASGILKGPTMVYLPATSQSFGNIDLADIPESFRTARNPNTGTRYMRTTADGGLSFIVGQWRQVAIEPSPQSNTESPLTLDVELYARYPLTVQEGQINKLTRTTALLTSAVGLAAALIGVLLSRQLLRPVTTLRKAVENFGGGEDPIKLRPSGVSELSEVIITFNETSSRLYQAMKALSESEERARRFVADVSHELRTPTTAMVASADLLANSATAPEHREEAAILTASAARRLARLTEDLLEISRFDAGQITVNPVGFNVGERLEILHEERGWSKDVVMTTDGVLTIKTDIRRFDIIVSNLVSNALTHGKTPVHVSVESQSDHLHLRVHDAGTGIAEADLPHLFERFYKSDRSRSRGGTGLGLALVAENILILGGRVSAASGVEGTTFTVELPQNGGQLRNPHQSPTNK